MTSRRNRSQRPTPPAATDVVSAAEPQPTLNEPTRWVRLAVLLAGILIPQVILLGSSLWGGTLLLPLDILGLETTYLPRPPGGLETPKDSDLSDLVFEAEVHRKYVVEEVRAGRIPLWNPYNYCGHPLLAGNQSAVFSPYRVLDYLWPSPVAVAWSAVLRALVVGVGTYLFFRRAMGVHWLAASAGAWWFPLSGTLVLSGGYVGAAVITFLPWILLAADVVAKRPSGPAIAGLALAVAAALLAGHAAFAGQVLVVGSIYFVARLAARRGISVKRRLVIAAAGIVGVAGGFLLSAPQTLPTIDYLGSSNRIARRTQTIEDKPAGAAALLQLVLPYIHGSSQHGSRFIGQGVDNRIESAAGGYAGLLVALVLAPLALVDKTRRRWVILWLAMAFFAVVPTVGIPLLDLPFKLPPLSLLRNNRLVFAAAFALVSLGVLGLNSLVTTPTLFRRPHSKAAIVGGMLLAIGLALWCGMSAAETPVGAELPAEVTGKPVAANPAAAAAASNPLVLLWPDSWGPATAFETISWFGLMYRNGLLLSVLSAMFLLVLFWAMTQPLQSKARLAVGAAFAVVALAELVTTAFGVNSRADPALYYPRLGWMDTVSAGGGRVCGVHCLPANVLLSHRISDIRGYDGADPQPTVETIQLARDTHRPDVSPAFAMTRLLSVDPRNFGPVANLLCVKYAIGRGDPPSGAKLAWSGQDYWVVENPNVLPRATVPRSVKVVPDPKERLRLLAAADHDPMAEALVESEGPKAGVGWVSIAEERPNRVILAVNLSQGGLVRLVDSWDAGWVARYDGQPIKIIRTDHALRGVEVPAGQGVIEFSFEPASFRWGLIVAAFAACGLGVAAYFWRPSK